MSISPRQSEAGVCEMHSPEIFMPGISCNLDSKFLNARDSIKEESMCVYARVRPVLPQEEAKGFKECIAPIDETIVRTVVPVNSSRYKNSRQKEEIVEDFSFNAAFGPEIGQFVFFQETMLTTLQNFVEGGNSLVFSYGITGSGKTYTLQGNSENPGIIPLSLRLYFATIEKQIMKDIKVKPHMYNNIIALTSAQRKEEYCAKKELLSLYNDECDIVPGSFRNSNNKTFAMTLCDLFSDGFSAEERQTTLGSEEMASAQAATYMKEVVRSSAENQLGVCNIWVSFVEIYNENIFDLLQPFTNDRKKLLLRECNGNVYIEGAREICISNGDEALKVLNIGRKQLSIASTKMNYQSSRSHCIYTIRVVRVRDANNLSTGRVHRLSFCDLAGSERAAKAQTTGLRLKEAGSINSSLLVLGRCLEQLRMNQMGKDKRMIPFRDSKLTRLFSAFFMGQGKAVMIANASPCDYTYDETFHVLKFSALARKLKVNDTFFSEVSSTLQSICNELSNTSNRSLCDESIDSEYDVIQEKDAIIEKLLVLAETLTKKEQEMAKMEMRIRQEVFKEYSEYSDQLLEDKRIMYENEMEAMRENYKRLISNRDKMYEKIIEDLNNQLYDSSEDTMNDSSSILDLESSMKSSPEKRLNLEKNAAKVKNAYESQKTGSKELQSTLESVTAELEKTKQELLESQKLITSLSNEIETCKKEIASLTQHSSGVSEQLKEVMDERESKVQNFEQVIYSLKTELREANKELQKIFMHSEELLSETETKDYPEKDESKEQENCKEFSDSYSLYLSVTQKLTCKINNLQQELQAANKNIDLIRKEMKVRESVSLELEKEIDSYKQEIEALRLETSEKVELEKKLLLLNQELESTKVHNKLISTKLNDLEIRNTAEKMDNTNRLISEKMKLEEELLSVMKELDTVKNDIQDKNSKLSESENRISMYELEVVKLRKEQAKNCEWEEELSLTKKELESVKKDDKHKLSELESRNRLYEMELVELRKEQKVKSCEWGEQLSLAKKELEDIKRDAEHKSSELKNQNSANELEVQRLKEQQQTLKMELTEKLHLSNEELKKANEEIQHKISKIQEYQYQNSAFELEVQRLKEQQQTLKMELTEKLHLSNEELKKANEEIQHKISKIQEYQHQMDILKQSEQSLISEKKDLQGKFVLAEKEIEALKSDVHQKSTHEEEIKNQIDVYKEELNKVKEEYKKSQSEKREVDEEVQCYKEKIEKLETNSTHLQKDVTIAENLNKLGELEKEILSYRHDIKKMRDIKKFDDQEKEDLKINISSSEEKIENLQSRLAELYILLEGVEKCEFKATAKIKIHQTIVEKHNSQVWDLHCQIRNKESSIEELEKALCDLQEQLKNVQRSCDQKLVSEKEQHEIEIEQTIKLKHLVEEENMSLKEQKQKSVNTKKPGVKKENPSKKNVDVKEKENFSRNTSTRALRKKTVNLKDVSVSSKDSVSPEINKQKSRKRVSDEDFCLERASKKMKPTESSKIPVKRTSKRKLQLEKTETLSPIQKIANTITSKVRVLSNNIPHISSPRFTRGRKKLFNPEASSSPLTERVRRGKK